MGQTTDETVKTGSATFSFEGMKTKPKMPVTLAIETIDNMTIPLIKKGEPLPKKFSQVFTTTGSFEMSTTLHLVLGDRPLASDNATLCNVQVDDGSFRSAGKPRYELCVEIDKRGSAVVRLKNLERDGKENARISYESAAISTEKQKEINNDAHLHAEEDATRLEKYTYLDGVRERIREIDEETWPVAKKKLTYAEKRGYKKCRKEIFAVIEMGPAGFDEAQSQHLDSLIEELDEWCVVLDKRAEQVMRWYGKHPLRKGGNADESC